MEKSVNSEFEDTIQCSFFSVSDTVKNYDELCESINKFIAALSQDYIWHRDEFKLCVSIEDKDKEDIPAHLTSTTCFGDNIEDEWFIVYLVVQITSHYTDLVVQIADNDGDFLLIEAADFLPAWANPETTENRVFIYQSNIHLIPPELIDLESNIDLQDAIKLVVQKSEETKATKNIQDAILRRISSYPQKIKDSHHRALVTLPVDIAALLTLKPSLVSPIVTTYCNLDILDAKCLKNIKLENCITVPILFTKYLYAMLMHSKLPRIRNCPQSSQNKRTTLGWKLASGYEILTSKLSEDIFSSTAYKRFINSLTKNGYFKNNIEGSKHYNELLEKAKKYFTNMECPLTSHYSQEINEIRNKEEFIILKESLMKTDNSDLCEEDDDKWLNINPDELNTFLNTHYGKKLVKCTDTITPQIRSDLTNFLNQTSDFEGIEYVKEEEKEDNQIEFDAEQFMNSIQNMLNIVSSGNSNGDNLDSDLGEESDDMMEQDLDRELAAKLKKTGINSSNDENVVQNLLQSIKEEGISGPSSNILKNIVVSNTDIPDSDDD
ncbi:protein ecdysoneless homolog [Epargyreus clarus]|uniref:protein ecdysoneless homolog n=1 Tax=Epargyreus clarus TaxID=520877 RepID=UPI003C2DF044